ncbi:MAG: arylsulfatase [Phycisphaeraceae bacterium]|nr:arylsulfatase [Phycisphaeraceae bacterium]
MNRTQLFAPNALTLFAIIILFVATIASATPPNIILVMPDDAGYGDYACLGNPVMRTPSVDAFKKQSLLFTRFHVSPTCAPSRAAIMGGRHEFKNGVTHTILERERMGLDTVTIADMLKSAGYTTGIFGKWHLGDEEAYRPESRGFDEVYVHGAGGIGQTFPGSCGDAPGNTNINPTLWHNGKFVKTKGYCTDLFFDQAIRWMDAKRQAKQPFFAYVSTNAPHAPHVLPEEYYKHYVEHPNVNVALAKFLGMIENIDTNFGKLLAKVDEWGIDDNTVVIYMGSDNGGTRGKATYNAGMRGGKNSSFQGGTRVPVFVRWPGGAVPANAECDALTAHVDLFPTFAQLADAELPSKVVEQIEGRSMFPLLKNPDAQWPDRLLVHHAGRCPKGEIESFKYKKSAIQNSRFTLVNNEFLFDLKNDPAETTNVIEKHPEVVAEFRAAYDKWWVEVRPYMINEDAVGPDINPFQELYYKQFGGSPTPEDLKRMKPRGSKKKS